MKKIIVGSLIASSLVYGINNVDLNVNNNTFEVSGDFSLNEAYELSNDSNYYLTVGFLNSEDKSAITSEKLASVGFKMLNPYIDDYGFRFGLGIKAVWADNSKEDFVSIPVQLFASYQIDEKISVDTDIAYAPRVLSFLKAQKFTSGKIKLNYKIMDNGFLYIGERTISTKYENDTTIKYDNSLFVGYQVQF